MGGGNMGGNGFPGGFGGGGFPGGFRTSSKKQKPRGSDDFSQFFFKHK